KYLDQYHIAWLLWPTKGEDWTFAESDYPEADLNQTSVCAFAHYGFTEGHTLQDSLCPAIDFTQWHTYRQEWGPGYRRYYLDGTLIGESTSAAYENPEVWKLQTEGHEHEAGPTKGHLLVDWVVIYEPMEESPTEEPPPEEKPLGTPPL